MLRCPNYMFLAQGLTAVGWEPEEAEIIERVRMPLGEAVELVMTGGITHGTSVPNRRRRPCWKRLLISFAWRGLLNH